MAFALSSSSCSDEGGGEAPAGVKVSCNPGEITATAEGGSYTIAVSTTGTGWTAYASDAWMSVQTDGTTAADGTVTVSVGANDGDAARRGLVVVRSGTVRDTVVVSQSAAMSLSAGEVYALSSGGTYSVGVGYQGEFTAASDAAWAKATVADGGVSISVEPNTALQSRTATVTVTSADGSQEISLRQESAPMTAVNVPEGYRLVWQDEFDEGTTLDPARWTHEVQGPGWVNNELQTYVDGSAAGRRVTELVDGKLNITCFKAGSTIYSGRVYADVDKGWKYGYIEARIMLPEGKGTWPAFWMMPVDNDFTANPWPHCGEIDIMESVGYDPNVVVSTIHCTKYNNTGTAIESARKKVPTAQDEFHVYAMEWTADKMTFLVDGEPLLTYANDGTGEDAWPFDKPFYVILNLAWGGAWGGQQGVDESCLPAVMKVDYVRVFQK